MLFLILLGLVPIALLMHYVFHAPAPWLFAAGILAIVPLAEWIRRATDNVAERVGPAIGGLLNVSFGNAAELILALFVLADGQQEVVKAQITGSIMGNSLLGLGLAICVGSLSRPKQTFKRERAGLLSSLLILSTIALLVPALFDYTERGAIDNAARAVLNERLALGVSVVLIVIYIANLIYTLRTHKDVFSRHEPREEAKNEVVGNGDAEEKHEEPWPLWKSISILVAATGATALMAEQVSGALTETAGSLGVSTFFLGIIVLAVIGNAAEYVAAVYFARKNQMGLVMTITVGSSIQVALLLAPLLVIVSHFSGHPMNLVFSNPLELIAVAGTAFVVNSIAQDGETTWFEGLLLLGVYLVLAFAFFYVAPPKESAAESAKPQSAIYAPRIPKTYNEKNMRICSQTS